MPPPLTLSKIQLLRFLSICASQSATKSVCVAMLRHHVATNISSTAVAVHHVPWDIDEFVIAGYPYNRIAYHHIRRIRSAKTPWDTTSWDHSRVFMCRWSTYISFSKLGQNKVRFVKLAAQPQKIACMLLFLLGQSKPFSSLSLILFQLHVTLFNKWETPDFKVQYFSFLCPL